MNLLYCGDQNTEDGLIISILSLLKKGNERLNIFVFTMKLKVKDKQYQPIRDSVTNYLNELVKKENSDNSVEKLDLSDLFEEELPVANLETRFTPYCMLRLFADKIKEIPDRILYLDTDVVCRGNLERFYYQNLNGFDLAGVLDYYGSWFFRRNPLKRDYINSGVMLLNMEQIRLDGLFSSCREQCRTKKMFMPDQSSINKLSSRKKILPRCCNEQRKLKEDTILQHFTTSFRFFPWIHTLTVKPWEIDRVHDKLKIHEYDDILEQYEQILAYLFSDQKSGTLFKH